MSIEPTYVNLKRAKDTLSSLVARALGGEEIVITRGGSPVVQLIPVATGIARTPGGFPELADVGDAVLEPLSQDELEAWEGG